MCSKCLLLKEIGFDHMVLGHMPLLMQSGFHLVTYLIHFTGILYLIKPRLHVFI